MAETKKRPAFPSMYALLYPMMAEAAHEHGYALALHGSLGRDMDVIAVPWTEDAVPAEELVEALCQRMGMLSLDDVSRPGVDPTPKPHGRLAWALLLTGGAYVDLSVMPLGAA